MSDLKLYMVIIGCKPPGRFTEQHDVFFGIGNSLRELAPQMTAFWKEAEGNIHIDAWREITTVDDYAVRITEKQDMDDAAEKTKLFFLNLGGYKENEFEEYQLRSYQQKCQRIYGQWLFKSACTGTGSNNRYSFQHLKILDHQQRELWHHGCDIYPDIFGTPLYSISLRSNKIKDQYD